jgi:hypothetical protein
MINSLVGWICHGWIIYCVFFYFSSLVFLCNNCELYFLEFLLYSYGDARRSRVFLVWHSEWSSCCHNGDARRGREEQMKEDAAAGTRPRERSRSLSATRTVTEKISWKVSGGPTFLCLQSPIYQTIGDKRKIHLPKLLASCQMATFPKSILPNNWRCS